MQVFCVLLTCLVMFTSGLSILHVCDRGYTRLGCYEEWSPGTPLLNDRLNIKWGNIDSYLEGLACKCAVKAANAGFAGFALHYYGECYGRTLQQLNELTGKNHVSHKCVGDQTYTTCEDKHSYCTGKDSAEAVYKFPSSSEENVNGGLSEWQPWTACDKECGSGLQHRERNCDNPEPKGSGKDCSGLGSLTESNSCKIKDCPVNGGYGSWTAFTVCSKSCGGGVATRARECNNPSPAHEGSDCSSLGPATESKACNEHQCPINGGWGSWGSYGSCSKICGSGIQTRTRSCTNPAPAHNGAQCSGSSSSSRSCNTDTCPSLGNCWTGYTSYQTHSSGNMVYIDRHRLNCGSSGNVLTMFHMQRDGGDMRYQYKCCKFQGSICALKHMTTSFNNDGGGDAVYLDRHTADCGNTGYINDFRVERNSDHNKIRYSYYCCNVYEQKWKTNMGCYTGYTSYTDDGSGKVYYLDRQTVSCSSGYALSYFRLQRNSDHNKWRYHYKCCKINY